MRNSSNVDANRVAWSKKLIRCQLSGTKLIISIWAVNSVKNPITLLHPGKTAQKSKLRRTKFTFHHQRAVTHTTCAGETIPWQSPNEQQSHSARWHGTVVEKWKKRPVDNIARSSWCKDNASARTGREKRKGKTRSGAEECPPWRARRPWPKEQTSRRTTALRNTFKQRRRTPTSLVKSIINSTQSAQQMY